MESGENKRRKHKRELEVSLAIETISRFFKNDPNFRTKKISILEFGSGDGYQIPYLQQIGNVVASDVYTSDGVYNGKGISFVQSSIANAPFASEQFDIAFSNHVIEHIEDIHSALEELKRIGKRDCIYAFSVPTNIWLLLSIPGEYYDRLRSAWRKSLSVLQGSKMSKLSEHDNYKNDYNRSATGVSKKTAWRELLHKICLPGHGVHSGFLECYRSFRIKKWGQLFSDNGFSIIETRPLLLYGSSQFPILPTINLGLLNRLNICSSVLFVLKRRE